MSLLSPLCRWENWRREISRHLLEITRLMSGVKSGYKYSNLISRFSKVNYWASFPTLREDKVYRLGEGSWMRWVQWSRGERRGLSGLAADLHVPVVIQAFTFPPAQLQQLDLLLVHTSTLASRGHPTNPDSQRDLSDTGTPIQLHHLKTHEDVGDIHILQ